MIVLLEITWTRFGCDFHGDAHVPPFPRSDCSCCRGCPHLEPRHEPGSCLRTKTPGARPAIEAINYATLQDAIDALPATGGIVRLPAGTFEISRPLRITQEDVLIE